MPTALLVSFLAAIGGCSLLRDPPDPAQGLPSLPSPHHLQVMQAVKDSAGPQPLTEFIYCDLQSSATAHCPYATALSPAPKPVPVASPAPPPAVAAVPAPKAAPSPSLPKSSVVERDNDLPVDGLSVSFAFKSSELATVDRELLDHWLALQHDTNAANYRVVVHTDDRGDTSRTLADDRRQVVIAAMQAAGVQGRFTTSLAAHDMRRRIVVVSRTGRSGSQQEHSAASDSAPTVAPPHPVSAAILAAPSAALPGTAVSREDSTTKEIHQ